MYKTRKKALKSICVIHSFKEYLVRRVTELWNRDIGREALYLIDIDNVLKTKTKNKKHKNTWISATGGHVSLKEKKGG